MENIVNLKTQTQEDSFDALFAESVEEVRVNNVEPLPQPNNLENFCSYNDEKVERAIKSYNSEKGYKNSNMLKFDAKSNQWIAKLYAGKQPLYLGGYNEKGKGIARTWRTATFEDAIAKIVSFTNHVRNGHAQATSIAQEAINRYNDSFQNEPRLQRGHS